MSRRGVPCNCKGTMVASSLVCICPKKVPDHTFTESHRCICEADTEHYSGICAMCRQGTHRRRRA